LPQEDGGEASGELAPKRNLPEYPYIRQSHRFRPIPRLVGIQAPDGRRFRVLTVIDQWSRESLSVEPGFPLSGTSDHGFASPAVAGIALDPLRNA
jgi:hypothetical protein